MSLYRWVKCWRKPLGIKGWVECTCLINHPIQAQMVMAEQEFAKEKVLKHSIHWIPTISLTCKQESCWPNSIKFHVDLPNHKHLKHTHIPNRPTTQEWDHMPPMTTHTIYSKHSLHTLLSTSACHTHPKANPGERLGGEGSPAVVSRLVDPPSMSSSHISVFVRRAAVTIQAWVGTRGQVNACGF